MAQAAPMPMCPMAKSCRAMIERPHFGLMMVIPGLVLIALGISVVVWPFILPWLVAAACVMAGGAMLLMAEFVRGMGARTGHAGR